MLKQPHVRNLILSTKGLPLGARAVLAEVCAMCEHGGRECFDANNRYLADTLGLTIPKVSAHLALLKDLDLLATSGSGNGEKRVIQPTEEWRDAYRNGNGQTLTEMIRVKRNPYRNGNGTLIETVRNPYRNGKHNRTKENEEQNPIPSIVETELLAANAALQKEVDSLKARLEKAGKEYRSLREQFNALKTQTPAAAPVVAKLKKDDPWAGKGKLITTAYREWYLATNQAAPTKSDAGDNVAARQIFKTLLDQPGVETDEQVVDLFSAMLQGWPKLEPFLQRQQKLSQISSNLTNILPQLIHHAKPSSPLRNPHGLVDHDKRREALALLKSIGL